MAKPKKKCCRSTPRRCANCPVVAKCKRDLKAQGMRGKELKRAIRAARAA